ncbi:hypothetical protein LSG31_00725 [Fodinisporobacter ferrooxydans]|uniref:Uncharacterized protein n=1 Tax=Fodinisporobacter ferrooxydans TaxID=2901836 RepID=A0ABY4CK00_9BACL|nr:hypothetical protein LSG31_00725 [Alicyclobacillaceae bacterium MYW30-H2]
MSIGTNEHTIQIDLQNALKRYVPNLDQQTIQGLAKAITEVIDRNNRNIEYDLKRQLNF